MKAKRKVVKVNQDESENEVTIATLIGYLVGAAVTAVVLALLALFSGCGVNFNEKETIHHQAETVTLPAPAVDEVARVVSEENEYRLAAGQAPIVPGLVCTLHNLIATQPGTIPANPPAAVLTYVYEGSFNQPESSSSQGMNILPDAVRSMWTQWYLIRCQGQLVVIVSDYELFSLTSDDGSNLYLGGVLTVNNDGNHSMQLRTNTKLLKRGIVQFKLDYMQGPAGNQGLLLEDRGGIIPGNRFYR